MPVPDALRNSFEQFADVQSRPITEAALLARMRSEATSWINAVHMQRRRVLEPLTDPADPRTQWEQQAADLHFLLVSLTRLRKAVKLAATEAAPLCAQLEALLADFDRRTEYLRRMRNVGEHFDDYTIGKGRDKQVGRAQLQTWNLTIEEDGRLTGTGWKGRSNRPRPMQRLPLFTGASLLWSTATSPRWWMIRV